MMSNKILLVGFVMAFSYLVKAQDTVSNYQPYGKISRADLDMKYCDFEKDANAEVLFDVGKMPPYSGIYLNRHVRIKIFNDQGKNEANVRLLYPTNFSDGGKITNLEAETINIEDNKIVLTPIDKKLIYTIKVDDFLSALTFTFPNVKAGSVIEYKFTELIRDTWYFQSNLPTRYSEIHVDFNDYTKFRYIPHVDLPYVKNVGEVSDYQQTKALANIPSFTDEPYMSSRLNTLQRVDYIIWRDEISTWDKIGYDLLHFPGFSSQFDISIAGEDKIIKQAKTLKTDDDKIAYIFDQVKTNMTWNDYLNFASTQGISRAWDTKTGNSAEINLILYRLLKKAGVKVYPLVVADRKSPKINPVNPNIFYFKSMQVYIPIDSARYYILDATSKYNQFNVLPQNVLNTFGFVVDTYGGLDDINHHTIFIEDTQPSTQSVFLNAEIKPGGTMEGTAQINSGSYDRVNSIEKYKNDGEKKYKDYLTNGDNNLQISSIKMENMDVDTLPLIQDINFVQRLDGSEDNYIYFNPNLFIYPHTNPFLNTTRSSDVDFGWRDNAIINGVFKIPAGYKIDALPKSILLSTLDGNISFKRVVNQQDDIITVRYVINHKKTIYFKNEYSAFSEFYKKMYEMLNEPIVLKKA